MALFNQKDNFEQETQKADKEAISSIIDANMAMKGELIFKGKARIDGSIEGNIKGEHLILSETGKVIGDIQASTFVCHGTLDGNAKASLITAKKSCNINGRLEGNSLTVEPGAKLNGEMKISSNELHLVNDKETQGNKATQVAEG